MFGKKRKTKKKPEEKPLDLEELIRKAYSHLAAITTIQKIDVEDLQFDFQDMESFVLVRSRGLSEKSPLFFTAGSDFLRQHVQQGDRLDSQQLLRWSYPLTPALWMRKSPEDSGEYELPFYYMDPYKGKQEDRELLFWDASPTDILRCTTEGNVRFYLCIESQVASELRESLAEKGEFLEGCKTFVLDEPGKYHRTAEGPDPLEIKIKDPNTFLAGRFFLPMDLTRDPLMHSSIRSLALSKAGGYYRDRKGLWFKLTFFLQDGETQWPLFYFFHQPESRKKPLEQGPFRQLVKILTRRMREQFSQVGIELSQLKGQFCGDPPPGAVSQCYLMNFYLHSDSRIVSGSLMVPVSLISFLVRKFAFPWSLVAKPDNPQNQLRMLFCLNQLFFSRNSLSVLPARNQEKRGESIEEFRKSFLTLNDLIALSSVRETRILLTNFLYRRGWTGATLPRLFYYVEYIPPPEESEDDQPGRASLYTLIGFQEDKLLQAMPRNMRDEWPRHGPSGSQLLSYNQWVEENFLLMKTLFKAVKKGEFQLPYRLKSILYKEFEEYGKRVDSYRESFFDPQKGHLDLSESRNPLLSEFFYQLRGEEGAALFYFHPEEMDHFGSLIPPAKRDSFQVGISRLKDHKEDEDEVLQQALAIRKRILLLNPGEDSRV